ncbi:MAG: hypothetical protein IK118_02630 [Clostridia bacterium]|nr:hypothetical protein [Clostridia bacterium]
MHHYEIKNRASAVASADADTGIRERIITPNDRRVARSNDNAHTKDI